MFYSTFQTSLCEIILVGDEQGLSNLHLNTSEGKRQFKISQEWERNDDFFKVTKKEIEEFLSGKRKSFTIKLNPQGTPYQKQVWKSLTEIPYGELRTYKQIAENLGNAKASRAVGMANSKNPIPLIIPCHRVIGANGKLTGFAHGLAVKKQLIDLEKKYV
jgi:methylated-DNA-[protein]-cysteine S-methyltransferase